MTKAMTEVKLKPYPFCGSEDFVLGFHEGHNEMRVKCKRCKTLFTIFDTPENAPKLWNRRTYCYQAERAVQDMTAEKAIEVLNKIGEETNIEDTLKNLSNSNIFTALKLAVHALEKQVAKKLKEVIRTSSNKKSRVKAFEHNYNHQNWQDQVPIPEYKEWQWTDYQCPIATPSSKRADLNFAGAEDRLLTGQMKRRVKIMKKGTTVESGYDAEGRWHLKLRKAKGKFTLDEIIEAAKEWEEDYYAVIIKAMSDETAQYYDDDLEGDYVTLYRATDFISKEV